MFFCYNQIMEKQYKENLVHYVVVTGIVVRDGRYLIAKRSEDEPAFPGQWTVPGGKVEVSDYKDRPKDTPVQWYGVLEDAVRREIMEEVNVEVGPLGYVTSLVYIRPDGVPSLVVSLWGEYQSGEVVVQKSEGLTEYAWVSLEEARGYDLIDGILEELEMLDRKLRGGEMGEWVKND